VKAPADADPMFMPIGCHCFQNRDGSRRFHHIAKHSDTLAEHLASRPDSFFVLVGWMLPGPPFKTVIMAFERTVPPGVDPIFDRLLDEMITGTDEQRRSRFKYLPRLELAPKVVMSGVKMVGGEKPTMLCNKLRDAYFVGPNYLEINIDISSSKFANMVSGIILPKITTVVVAHAFILQGNTDEELPERCLSVIRSGGIKLNENTVILQGPKEGDEADIAGSAPSGGAASSSSDTDQPPPGR